MKVLIIGPFPYPINGCSLANQVLAKNLDITKSVQYNVIDTNTVDMSSGTVGSFSFKKVANFLKHYKGSLSIRNYEVVYTTPGQTFLGIMKYAPFYLTCMLFKKPYIIHLHGNHLGNEYKLLSGTKKKVFHYLISRAAKGIVLSDLLKQNFEAFLPTAKVSVVENFSQDEFLTASDDANTKDATLLRPLYLSNLMEEKGILDFLDALIILKKGGVPFQAEVAGKIEDSIAEKIKARFSELGDSVHYHGIVEGKEKLKLLRTSNVFVLPTYYRMEGQPISLLEGMATGNIIVTTMHSGIPDIVSEANGFFVEKNNPQSVFEALAEISGNLEQYVKRISETNVRHIAANFTESAFSNKVVNVINDVAGSK